LACFQGIQSGQLAGQNISAFPATETMCTARSAWRASASISLENIVRRMRSMPSEVNACSIGHASPSARHPAGPSR
jgi:hypothetical protein